MAITRNTRVTGSRLGASFGGKDYWADLAKYELAPESSDREILTFGDAASGNGSAAWKLKGSAIQSFDTGSFWDFVWSNVGKTIAVVLAPHGNKTASVSKPHFKMNIRITSRPSVSAEAGDEKGSTFDFEFNVEGEPEKVVAGSTLGAGNFEDAIA